MDKQLNVNDIINAKEIYFYSYGDVLFIIDENDDAYGFSEGRENWYYKSNFWDYFESETMLYYLKKLTKEEAVELYQKWTVIDETK